MGIIDLFKKRKSGFTENTSEFESGIFYKGIPIAITDNIEESKIHLEKDYAILNGVGIENIIREKFLPWFKIEEFKDRDNDRIIEGLKIDDISYEYIGSIGTGSFEFQIVSCSNYTEDMLEAVCMELTVNDGNIEFKGWEV